MRSCVAVAVISSLCALFLAAPATAAPPSSARVYWGAQIGSQLTGTQAPWDMNAVTQFEAMAGKPVSMVHFAAPFANCSSSPCEFYPFPATLMDRIRLHGSIPFFSWASQSIGQGGDPRVQPDFQLSDVTAGTYDSFIRSWATAAKAWGQPFFLRFNFEMNGNWFAWAEGVNGNQPGDYVAAWRHVHDIFTSVGANNATWVWCPYVDPNSRLLPLAPQYPGNSYVDWTCLDGFNWGTNPAATTQGWRSFDRIFSSTYHQITDTIAPSKPLVIGEIGSTEYGGSKAGWITNMFSWLPSLYPKIRGLLWLEAVADGMDWPIETSQTSINAFAKGIKAAPYAKNSYGSLNKSPIPPPGG